MSKHSKTPACHRQASRSPVAVAQMALKVGQKALPPYSSKFSRHDFTQAQLFAVLVLKSFYRTDYRGIVAELADHSDLRKVLGLRKIMDFTTLFKAEQRLMAWGFPQTPAGVSGSGQGPRAFAA